MHHYLLTTQAQITTSDGTRRFSGIANSGKPFVYGDKKAIVDLSDISFADKVPMLLLHDRDKRVGVGTLSVKDNQLVIDGTLMDNAHAQSLISEADAGFPFQLSAHIIAESEELLEAGNTATVNGHAVSEGITILRHCRVPEVSFTPTGVDSGTMAMILSQELATPQSTPKTSTKAQEHTVNQEMQALQAQIDELTQAHKTLTARIQELEDENQNLKDNARTAQIEAKLSQKGFDKDDKGAWQGIQSDTLEVLLSLDNDKAAKLIDALPTPKRGMPEYLLGEQYSQGTANTAEKNPLVANAKSRKV